METQADDTPQQVKEGSEVDLLRYKLMELQAEYDCFKQEKMDEIVRLNYQVSKLTKTLQEFEYLND